MKMAPKKTENFATELVANWRQFISKESHIWLMLTKKNIWKKKQQTWLGLIVQCGLFAVSSALYPFRISLSAIANNVNDH